MNVFSLDNQSLHFLESALGGDVQDADFKEYLDATQSYLLDPLKYKVRISGSCDSLTDFTKFFFVVQEKDSESRQTVESGKIATRDGVRTLDAIPDIQETLLLSDELDLDAIDCFHYIEKAFAETGEVSAVAAAGEFYGQRLAAIRSVFILLYNHVTGFGIVPEKTFEILELGNLGLLKETTARGETLLVRNLCRSIRSSVATIKDVTNSKIPYVKDSNGEMVPRSECISRESLVRLSCVV